MDADRFDTLTKTLATTANRRGVVRLLTALPITGGLFARLAGPPPETLSAPGKGKGKGNGRDGTKPGQSNAENHARDERPKGDGATASHRRKSRDEEPAAGLASETATEESLEESGDEVSAASHGCRHAGARCKRGRQCCTGRCVRSGGKKKCSCDANNECLQPADPCKEAVCSDTSKCVIQNNGSDTVCRTASCTNGVATWETTCDGSGNCPENSVSCSPYQCHETLNVCIGSCGGEEDCINTHFCKAGTCVPKVGTGETCSRSVECISNACLNSICLAA